MKLRIALVQMSAGPDKRRNVSVACDMIEQAARSGARFVLLPEVFSFVADASQWRRAAESIPGPTSRRLAALARRHDLHILAGSILEKRPGAGKCANTSLLINPAGRIVARYSKMHLFTVKLPGGVVFDEVDHTVPGRRPVVAKTRFGDLGMTICYDLRFPELFRTLTLMGAQMIAVPSAFTAFTGQAHWKVLLQARAIENQVFILAPNQVGTSATGVRFHGHSLVVDPWGVVLAEGDEDERLVTTEIDTGRVAEVRERLQAVGHVRKDLLERLAGAGPRKRRTR